MSLTAQPPGLAGARLFEGMRTRLRAVAVPRGWWRAAALVTAATLMQLAVVAVGGRPAVFTDTDDYFAQGRTLTHAAETLATQGRLPFKLSEARDRLSGRQADEEPIHNQNNARSGYYGALLFNLQRLGSVWALAAAQAASAAWLVWLLWREVGAISPAPKACGSTAEPGGGRTAQPGGTPLQDGAAASALRAAPPSLRATTPSLRDREDPQLDLPYAAGIGEHTGGGRGPLGGGERNGGDKAASSALRAAPASLRATSPSLRDREDPGVAAGGYLLLMAALSAGSALPFFTAFAMPDVFVAFAALATAALVAFGDRLGRAEIVALWLLLAAAANFHGSAPPILAGLAVLGALLLWRVGARRRAGVTLGLVLSAIVAATLAGSVYGLAVKLRSGDTLRRPPFLAVRVLADGPGRRYLRAACARDPHAYALCAFKALPLDDTEDMLWSDDGALGLYNTLEFPVREALSKEETRFVLHAVAADPMGEAAAAVSGFVRQLVSFDVAEPLENPKYYLTDSYWSDTNLPRLVLGMGGCGLGLDRCGSRFAPAPLAAWHYAGVAAALAFAGWRLARTRALQRLWKGEWDAGSRLAACALLLLAAVALNAAVCGALSGVFPRYQARIVWLVPLAALLLANRPRPAA